MTTLIAWIAFDQRRPASFYLASDSRITWGSYSHRWDAGRKLFASTIFPDMFGYAGDVVFPCLCLSQIVDALDRGVLCQIDSHPEQRAASVFAAVQRSFSRRHRTDDRDFTIFYASRVGKGGCAEFLMWKIEFSAIGNRWFHTSINVPSKTDIVCFAGSGGRFVEEFAEKWMQESGPGRSRSIFSGFCDALGQQRDPLSGGAPQLTGLYPIECAKSFGILFDNQLHLHGLPLSPQEAGSQIEWRDRLLQRINGQTLDLLSGAQRHARPVRLREI